MNEIETVPIVRLTEAGGRTVDDVVAREFPLTLIFNNRELVTLLCSPADLDCLAVGFLSSEGFFSSKDEIKKIMVDAQKGIVRVETSEESPLANDDVFKRFITSGCGRGASFYSAADVQGEISVTSQTKLSAHQVFTLVGDFQHHSELYRATGGVHSAALCDNQRILVFKEDIGRHNAIDKIFGECILKDIPTDGRIVVTSGRVSSEILLKVAKRNIPFIISKSAPTSLGVKLANDLGVTILGFVRGKRINCYTHNWRITLDGKQGY